MKPTVGQDIVAKGIFKVPPAKEPCLSGLYLPTTHTKIPDYYLERVRKKIKYNCKAMIMNFSKKYGSVISK